MRKMLVKRAIPRHKTGVGSPFLNSGHITKTEFFQTLSMDFVLVTQFHMLEMGT